MAVISLRIIQKKMKKLEKVYDRTPKECSLARFRVEKKMQKLIDRASWLRGKACEISVREEHKKMEVV